LISFAQLVDAKFERRIIALEDDREPRQRGILRRSDVERVNVEAAAGEHASDARQHAELIFNED